MWKNIKTFLMEREDIAGSLLHICRVVGAIIGFLLIEYAYFTNAEEVRLLFVLVLAPVGAVMGGVVAHFMAMLVPLGAITAIVLVTGATVCGIIWILYSIVVWTN